MTNDQEIIRQAVELAKGFRCFGAKDLFLGLIVIEGVGLSWPVGDCPKCIIDALAAQLVRQVGELSGYHVQVGDEFSPSRAMVFGPDFRTFKGYMLDDGDVEGSDRTMNTLRAIVESKVLE